MPHLTFVGAKIVLMHKWDPARALELIEREQAANWRAHMSANSCSTPIVSRHAHLGRWAAAVALQPDLVEDQQGQGGSAAIDRLRLTETHGIITAVGNIFFTAADIGWPHHADLRPQGCR